VRHTACSGAASCTCAGTARTSYRRHCPRKTGPSGLLAGRRSRRELTNTRAPRERTGVSAGGTLDLLLPRAGPAGWTGPHPAVPASDPRDRPGPGPLRHVTHQKEKPAIASSVITASRECGNRDEEQDRRAVSKGAGQHSRRSALPRAAAFWLVVGVLCLLFFASGAPSPLYGIHQAQLRFPVAALTAVFAVYALVLLITCSSSGQCRPIWAAVASSSPPSRSARAGCSWRRTASYCCSPPGCCRVSPSARRLARSARR
jgi:hypothetical protein